MLTTIIFIELFILVVLILVFFAARLVCFPNFAPHHWEVESKSYVNVRPFGIAMERNGTTIIEEDDAKNACEYKLICRQCGKEKTKIMPCTWHPEDEKWD